MSNVLDTIQLSGSSYDLKDKNAANVSAVTQAEYDNLPTSAKTSNTLFVITDAQAGDLTQYWTSAQTNSAITQAVSGKQDTLVSGTNIKTINNESLLGSGNIDIQGGGGKAVEAGRGITVTTGATADTVSFNLPISAGTANMGNITCCGSNTVSGQYAVAFGNGNTTSGGASLTFGRDCSANSYDNVAGGFGVTTRGTQASSFGQYTKTENVAEHSVGRYNASNKANTTWGDSGNTLFSVGNGTANNARHNAFEIRQNGDIYLSSGGTDIKLQDHLGGGGSITVDSTLDSGSTNPVENQALYDELRIENAPVETTLTFEGEGGYSTNYPNGCTQIKVEVVGDNNWSSIDFYDDNQSLGNIAVNYWGSISVDNYLDGATYEISGTTLIISYPTVTNVAKIQVRGSGNYVYKAVTTGTPTALKDQVVANTTALGGLKLVKLTQAQYDAMVTKDSNTLYVIVN